MFDKILFALLSISVAELRAFSFSISLSEWRGMRKDKFFAIRFERVLEFAEGSFGQGRGCTRYICINRDIVRSSLFLRGLL